MRNKSWKPCCVMPDAKARDIVLPNSTSLEFSFQFHNWFHSQIASIKFNSSYKVSDPPFRKLSDHF